MKEFPFLGPAYQNRSDNYSSSRMVNMYLEKGQGKKPWVMIGTPGLTTPAFTLADGFGNGGIRGVLKLDEVSAVWICGAVIWVTHTNGTLYWGLSTTIAYDSSPVTMATDGTNILICSAGRLYAITVTPSAATWTGPTELRSGVGSVDFIDGYFIINEEGSGKFYISNQYSTTIDALDFATAEGAPDNLVRVLVHNREAILFGEETIEFWYVSGNADFAMSRIPGAYIEEGLAAKHSAVKCGETVAWLGSSKDGAYTVWMLNGYTPKPISTHAISYQIAQWGRVDDAVAFYYKQEGHAFYVLTSPTASQTIVYDFATDQWHERAWLDGIGNLKRIRPIVQCHMSGMTLVGDWENGNVYEYDLNTYSDNGSPIQRVRSTQMTQSGLDYMRNGSLRLDMDTGVGLETGQGDDPQAALRYSKDGGKNWTAPVYRSFGRIGEFGTSVRWNRVGGGERSVYEVTITDPVKVNITGAYFE